jgi:hypothetical protein
MGPLNNTRHERFAQRVVSGSSLAAAYVAAGYKKVGANANAARLMRDVSVSSRINELRNASAASFLQLAVIDRGERLLALQECFDGLRQARLAFAVGDYEAAMRTGFVCRRIRWVGGKDGREVEEYEVNVALIESLNSVEKRAAVETGQEQENVAITGQISAKSIALSKVLSMSELEAIEKKMLAAMEAERAGKLVEVPKP